MKKLITIAVLTFFLITLTACQSTVVCGEGTIIKDGQCVAPEQVDDNEDPNDNENPNDNETPSTDLSCDSLTGEVFYQVNFNDLASSLVDNEVGNEHTSNNFVVWGKNDSGQVLASTSVQNNALVVSDLAGSQTEQYYDTGLGYQYLTFESDVNYTVCAIVEGPSGQSVTSEIGIYYGFGTKDDLLLTGEPQMIMQDFRTSMSTNTDRGQYVLFTGNINGEFTVHEIKIVKVS